MSAIFPRFERSLGSIQITDNDRQKVIEVVRHPARELSDGFHFLRLIQLLARAIEPLLRFPFFGHIARDLGKPDKLSVRIKNPVDYNAGPKASAVLAQPPALSVVSALRFRGSKCQRRNVTLRSSSE